MIKALSKQENEIERFLSNESRLQKPMAVLAKDDDEKKTNIDQHPIDIEELEERNETLESD